MTTIAYRDGIMVADSKRQDGADIKIGDSDKIVLHDDCIVGCAGDVPLIILFQAWIRNGMPQELPPDFKGDRFSAIQIYADGQVDRWNDKLVAIPMRGPFHAIGSGGELALGAMAAGATAEEAVTIACEYDAHSDGPLQIVKVCQ